VRIADLGAIRGRTEPTPGIAGLDDLAEIPTWGAPRRPRPRV